MKNNMTLSESVIGWLYLFIQVFLLSIFLEWANDKLPTPMNNAWLTFTGHCISFLLLVAICHSYLANAASNFTKNALPCLTGLGLGFCVYYTCTTLLSKYMGSYFPEFFNPNDTNIAALLKLDFLPMSFGTIFLVPFIEEVLYRGIVFREVYNRNKALGYILSTLIFSSVHLMGYAETAEPFALFLCFLQYLPAGFTLAWTYVNSDNIFAPIMLHMIINAMGVYSMR